MSSMLVDRTFAMFMNTTTPIERAPRRADAFMVPGARGGGAGEVKKEEA